MVPYIVDDKARWPSDQIEALVKPEVLAPLREFKEEVRKSLAAWFADVPSLLEKLETALREAADRIADRATDRATERQPAGERGTPATSTRRASVPPEELPCLCDRDDQEEAVRGAVSACLDRSQRRPLVFVLHGPADEAHRAFVDRLRVETLPSVLERLPDRWPRFPSCTSLDDYRVGPWRGHRPPASACSWPTSSRSPIPATTARCWRRCCAWVSMGSRPW